MRKVVLRVCHALLHFCHHPKAIKKKEKQQGTMYVACSLIHKLRQSHFVANFKFSVMYCAQLVHIRYVVYYILYTIAYSLYVCIRIIKLFSCILRSILILGWKVETIHQTGIGINILRKNDTWTWLLNLSIYFCIFNIEERW